MGLCSFVRANHGRDAKHPLRPRCACEVNQLPFISRSLSDPFGLISFAFVAVSAPKQYVKPKLVAAGEGDIILKQARHPCLEMMDDNTNSFIPNDVSLIRGT